MVLVGLAPPRSGGASAADGAAGPDRLALSTPSLNPDAELDGVATEIRRRGRLAGLQRALRGVRQHRQAKHLRRVRGRGLGGRHVQRLVRLHVLGVRREEIALAESIVAQLFFFLGGGQGFARGAKHVLARHDGFDVTRNLLGDRAELGDRRELPGQGRVGAIARGRHRRATENGLQAPRQHSRVVTRQFSIAASSFHHFPFFPFYYDCLRGQFQEYYHGQSGLGRCNTVYY